MTKIILLCAAGMSTSALVRKMQDAAKLTTTSAKFRPIPLLTLPTTPMPTSSCWDPRSATA